MLFTDEQKDSFTRMILKGIHYHEQRSQDYQYFQIDAIKLEMGSNQSQAKRQTKLNNEM
uniref:Uncharacterized protein n=1 Tax=Tetranychus urticae TaxID=32264 RepID=T1KU43_TETUR